jgi:DNA repair protein RadA/Sms
MAKPQTLYICQSCGYTVNKWAGKCEGCGEWNTLVQETISTPSGKSVGGNGRKASSPKITLVSLEGEDAETPRLCTQLGELDRVLGGGMVAGSVILIGGDPGIGKSTLLIQTMALLANQGYRAVYISGEEAIGQVRMRAKRLGLSQSPVELGAETNLRMILSTLESGKTPDVVVIDSIQTLWLDTLESAPGTVSQVRASAQDLVRFAKTHNTCVILVGHMTKDGQIAGPRTVEHMVDTVLYFEGERGLQFRVLRGVKNRFGPVDEIGVFEMTGLGLAEVLNPSALFLGDRIAGTAGTAIFAGMEGTRPFLIEIQALVAPAAHGNPRRALYAFSGFRCTGRVFFWVL